MNCDGCSYDIIQTAYIHFYTSGESHWETVDSHLGVLINGKILTRSAKITNSYFNVFGRQMDCLGMKQRWGIKGLSKDPDYWYLCSKIGIVDVEQC